MHQRHPIVLPALCWGRLRPEFHAITTDVSKHGICLKSSVQLNVGDEIFCSIRYIGTLDAVVSQVVDHAFFIRIQGQKELKVSVNRQFLALSDLQIEVPEPQLMTRQYSRRIVPKRRAVQVRVADGTLIPGRIINVSESGVALGLEPILEVGASIMIGSTMAKVVRHLDNGVGALFLTPFKTQDIHEAIIL